jgi:hypothetical protein
VSQSRAIAGSAATPGIASPGSQRAASQPLPTSMKTVAAAKANPWVRSALVPPALPLPIVRMSTPRNRPITSAPTMDPSR